MPYGLMAALSACAGAQQEEVTIFLQGLSRDELNYIAEFLGACILECAARLRWDRAKILDTVIDFESRRRTAPTVREDDHKMLVLMEFLSRVSVPDTAKAMRAG